jgi:hypothetical protein
LELPVLRDIGVVVLELGQSAHERAGLALRPQCGVDLPQRGFGARVREDAAHPLGQLRRQMPTVLTGGGVEHEDDIDIGDVVELSCSGLARAITARRISPGTVEFGPGDRQGGVEGGRGEIGQDRHDVIDDLLRGLGTDIVGDQPHHRVAIGPAQHSHAFVADQLGLRCRGVGVGADSSQQFGPQCRRRGLRRQDQQVGIGHEQERQGVRIPHEVVDHRLRGAHDGEQTGQQRPVELVLGQFIGRTGPDRAQHPLGLGSGGFDDSEETEGGTVRIGGGHEQIDESGVRGQRLAQELIELVKESGGRIRNARGAGGDSCHDDYIAVKCLASS